MTRETLKYLAGVACGQRSACADLATVADGISVEIVREDAMRRNKLAVYIHFVWGTWDRQPVITASIERDLHRGIESLCLEAGCPALAVGGTADHVHLLVALSSTITLGELM